MSGSTGLDRQIAEILEGRQPGVHDVTSTIGLRGQPSQSRFVRHATRGTALQATARDLLHQDLAHERPVVGEPSLLQGRLNGVEPAAGALRSTASLLSSHPLSIPGSLVHSLCGILQFGDLRSDAHRQVALVQRHDGGEHGVGGTVGSKVVDVGAEGFATLDGVPHGQERRFGHRGVSNDVVRRTDEIVP